MVSLQSEQQSYSESRAPPVELEYVPALQAVHAEDPAECHPRAPRRIRAAVITIPVTPAKIHAFCPPCRSSAYIDL
jgi:hypothetical protein